MFRECWKFRGRSSCAAVESEGSAMLRRSSCGGDVAAVSSSPSIGLRAMEVSARSLFPDGGREVSGV